MILAPAIMAAEKVAKNAAAKCLEAVGLDQGATLYIYIFIVTVTRRSAPTSVF